MSTFEREHLLSVLTDAKPALSAGGIIPALSHFWFDTKYVYAYDGGLGVRLDLKSELDCGIPGKTLYDLLKTSTVKEVFLDIVKDDVVLQLGKPKVKLAPLDGSQTPWNFPASPPKKEGASLVLSEQILAALHRVLFVRASKPIYAVNHGVTFEPFDEHLELYTTDNSSIAQVVVDEQLSKDVPRFVAPWAFLGSVLELVEPGAVLHVLDNCLMVGAAGVLICSNVMELPDKPDLPDMVDRLLTKQKPIALPTGFQSVLDRVLILAGADEALLTLTTSEDSIHIQAKYVLGSVDETLPLKGKPTEVTGQFSATLISRALSHADSFSISKKALALHGGKDFLYIMAAKTGK